MMEVLELLQLAKGMFRDKVTLNSKKIKSVAIAIIDLRLSEGIIKLLSKSVSQQKMS